MLPKQKSQIQGKGLTTFLKNLLGEERFNQLTEVDINKYLKDLEQANNIRNEVMQFVKPLYEKLINENTKNSNKKANELISIGRFFNPPFSSKYIKGSPAQALSHNLVR